jgi:hypothetical protein
MTTISSSAVVGTILFCSSMLIQRLFFTTPTGRENIRDYLTKVSIKTRNSKTIYLESFDDYDHKNIQSNDSTDNNSNSKDITAGMIRSDSEYSMGFSRSKSFQQIMSEVGPFCDTGEFVIKILRFGGFAVLTVFIVSNLYRKKKHV